MQKALIAALAAAAIGGGAWYVSQRSANTNVEQATSEDMPIFDVVEMVQGNPDAAVEVIEYASFTCPHCASFHANQYQDLKENYIDTGLIRFVYREVYFDQPGLWASMVARCGGEMRYFGISGLIYESQQEWARLSDGAQIAAALRNIGKVAGLTDEELDVCMTDADQAQTLMAWYRHNADLHDIQGTPSFVIEGEKYSNMNYSDFAALLDEKLADSGQ